MEEVYGVVEGAALAVGWEMCGLGVGYVEVSVSFCLLLRMFEIHRNPKRKNNRMGSL